MNKKLSNCIDKFIRISTLNGLSILFGVFLLASSTAASEGLLTVNQPELSGDGGLLLFTSSEKLVETDNNDLPDAYLLNKLTNEIRLVSVSHNGLTGDGSSIAGSLSKDGQFATFSSLSKNFLGGRDAKGAQVFLKNLRTEELIWVSQNAPQDGRGYFGSELSGNGELVAYHSESMASLYVYDIPTKHTSEIIAESAGSHSIYGLSLSDSGRYLAFSSSLQSLIGAGTPGQVEVFVYDLSSRQFRLVSHGEQGQYGNDSAGYAEISGNGRYVVWSSAADNLVAGDSNDTTDIFWRDLQTSEMKRIVSSIPGGASSYPRISQEGDIVVFETLSDFSSRTGISSAKSVYSLNLTTGRLLKVVSQSDTGSNLEAEFPTISSDGSQVSYVSRGSVFELANLPGREVSSSPPGTVLAVMDSKPGSYALAANLGLVALLRTLIVYGGLAQYQLLVSRQLLSLLSFLGLRKKRRVWGTVYDSQTKQPLDPAVVELIDSETGQVKERAITDLAGRFGFLATQGNFLIRASKTHYSFPSKLETGYTDEIFGNLYHGELILLRGNSTLVAPNIPMDPTGFDWNQAAKQRILPSRLRLSYLVRLLLDALFLTGFTLAVWNLVVSQDLLDVIVVALYVFTTILALFGKRRLWGRVSKQGKPLAGVKVELVHPKFNVVMGKALSTIDGKFFLKVPEPGEYKMRVSTRHGLLIHESVVSVGKERVFNSDLDF